MNSSALGRFSDASEEHCEELRFIAQDDYSIDAAFKTSSLKAVAARALYMHAGQKRTLDEVIEQYKDAPDAAVGHSELNKIPLSDQEVRDVVDFLNTLTGPIYELPPRAGAL